MTVSADAIQQVLARHADDIGARIGADPSQTQQAISVALPALLQSLQGQTSPDSGLQQAIEQDHDGSILDDLAGYVNGSANLGSRTTDGQGILDHLLGAQQPQVVHALSSQTGLNASSIMQLLPMLAPIVMGMLGRQARTSGSGSASTGGFGDLGSILGGLLGGSGSGTGSSGGIGDVLGSILGANQRR
jgi:hypothetical protein